MTTIVYDSENFQDTTYEEKRFKFPLLTKNGTMQSKLVDYEVIDAFGEVGVQLAFEITEDGPDHGKRVSTKEIQISGDYFGRPGVENLIKLQRSCGAITVDGAKALHGKEVNVESILGDLVGKTCYPTFKASAFEGRNGDVVFSSRAIASFKTPEAYAKLKADGRNVYDYDRNELANSAKGINGADSAMGPTS